MTPLEVVNQMLEQQQKIVAQFVKDRTFPVKYDSQKCSTGGCISERETIARHCLENTKIIKCRIEQECGL